MEWLLIAALAVVVGIIVLRPLLQHAPADYDWDGTAAESRRSQRLGVIEKEVLRYREALRAGTVCTRCSQANPAGSRFCGDCGRPLQNVQGESASVQVPST